MGNSVVGGERIPSTLMLGRDDEFEQEPDILWPNKYTDSHEAFFRSLGTNIKDPFDPKIIERINPSNYEVESFLMAYIFKEEKYLSEENKLYVLAKNINIVFNKKIRKIFFNLIIALVPRINNEPKIIESFWIRFAVKMVSSFGLRNDEDFIFRFYKREDFLTNGRYKYYTSYSRAPIKIERDLSSLVKMIEYKDFEHKKLEMLRWRHSEDPDFLDLILVHVSMGTLESFLGELVIFGNNREIEKLEDYIDPFDEPVDDKNLGSWIERVLIYYTRIYNYKKVMQLPCYLPPLYIHIIYMSFIYDDYKLIELVARLPEDLIDNLIESVTIVTVNKVFYKNIEGGICWLENAVLSLLEKAKFAPGSGEFREAEKRFYAAANRTPM